MSNKAENQAINTIAVSASFTAESLQESLNFWEKELQNPFKIEFVPYNQVFQQLLDASSLLSQNDKGINVILLRFEDWIRDDVKSLSSPDNQDNIKVNVDNLVIALKSASERSSTPCLVCVCPPSLVAVAREDQIAFHKQMEDHLSSELSGMGNVYLVTTIELTNTYPVSTYYDPESDQLGHVPYTSSFFTALGTLIVRKFYAMQSATYKVVLLDCDQTLWKGICGEDGPLGIEIDPPRKKLQEFIVRQHNFGMLVCLCSKNNEEDVVEVFDHHPEMPLQREHIVSWQINWKPKSENLRALAHELHLGLDSFIFIDDNPVECAEVRANCPEVLTLCLPKEPVSIPRFLEHIWAFDRMKITEEDKKRTILYKQNIEREHFRRESLTLEDFLAGLELEVRILEAMPHHLTRVAQLTQRTNQLNFTTIRRSEVDVGKLLQSEKLECLVIEVSDRFGDYGLVGVVLFETDYEAIKVDTFLLSCRVLGRGIEHKMLAMLGEIAKKRGLSYVQISYVPTNKNQPAIDFLDEIGSQYKEPLNNTYLFKFPTEYASKLNYATSLEKPTSSNELISTKLSSFKNQGKEPTYTKTKSEVFHHIATNLYNAEQILNIIESQNYRQRPDVPNIYVPPGNNIECSIANIWQKILCIDRVGIQDNFFEMGGTSLKGVQLIAELRREFNVNIPVVTLFERPTIGALAKMFDNDKNDGVVNRDAIESRTRGEKRREIRRLRRS